MTHLAEDLNTVAAAAAGGDDTAMNELMGRVHPMVSKYCRRKLAGFRYCSAEDVTQEVCAALVTALPRYEDRGKFTTFVYGIASHKVADVLRSAQRLPVPIGDVPENAAPDETGPAAAALREYERRRIASLLSVLTYRQRHILQLRVVDGLSSTETAAALGITAGAVRVGQHRALSRLRAALVGRS